ncbi:MAG: NusG domain II-containing protein [Clostridia bacterium]
MKIKGFEFLKGDIIIVASICVLAVVTLLFMLPESYDKTSVEIYLDGELIETVELSEAVYETIEIEDEAQNIIEIDGLQVRIIESTCYDHVCENTGYISKAGEVIVCMPNKLLVKIVGEESANEYDAVV